MVGIQKLIFRYTFRRGINAFAVILVMLAVALLFTVNGVMKGFHRELQYLFRGSSSDLTVEWSFFQPNEKDLKEQFPGVTFAPVLDSFGMLRGEKDGFRFVTAIQIKGVAPVQEMELRKTMGDDDVEHLSLLNVELKDESSMGGLLEMFGETTESYPLVIGSVLAERLKLQLGDPLDVTVPNWSEGLVERGFHLAAIHHSGYFEDDSNRLLVPISTLESMVGQVSRQHQVALGPGVSPETITSQIIEKHAGAEVSSWRDRHGQRLRAVSHERRLMAIVLSFIVIVASFAILAIQLNFVREKTRDIGILRAMGFAGSEILFTFLGVSWIVGITGTVLGFGFGAFVSLNANDIISFTGWRPFPGDLYYHEDLPVSLEWSDVIWISCLSFAVTTLAALWPALNAIKVEPVTAIAHE